MHVTCRRAAVLIGVTVVLSVAASCSDGVGGHAEERELLDATEFADVESVVSTEDHRDEVERIIVVTPDFDPERSITPPEGWRFVEVYDRGEWSEDDALVFSFDGPGPSKDYSDCDIAVVTRSDDTQVEVHVNCVRTA